MYFLSSGVKGLNLAGFIYFNLLIRHAVGFLQSRVHQTSYLNIPETALEKIKSFWNKNNVSFRLYANLSKEIARHADMLSECVLVSADNKYFASHPP